MIINDGKQWQGKKWYCYGTSMTDNSGQDSTFITGQYSKFLAEYAGLEEHNFGKGGSGIVPAIHGTIDSIKTRCMRLDDGKAEADLITLEIIPNDMKADLGDVYDTGDDSFCGNLNQILQYLLENTRATVVVLIPTRTRHEVGNKNNPYSPKSDYMKHRIAREKAVEEICYIHGVPCFNASKEANLGFYRVTGNDDFLLDQAHNTEEGGRILAQYYWGKLKNLYPLK
ncbi:MAG: SGNH/GDSL hydrolase family protein [Clostridia bacterium]|nr:SGNH/GDSL hydrolase family protein [Clostridia bacterium]